MLQKTWNDPPAPSKSPLYVLQHDMSNMSKVSKSDVYIQRTNESTHQGLHMITAHGTARGTGVPRCSP